VEERTIGPVEPTALARDQATMTSEERTAEVAEIIAYNNK
jgi:hypothetical protein